MSSVTKTLFENLTESAELSATVTVLAMLIAGTLAKLEIASWGIAVIGTLCVLHLALQARSMLAATAARRAPTAGGN